MMFHRGQKVVCIDESGWNDRRGLWNYPVKGSVYTVRELTVWWDGMPGIRVEEITNEVGWSSCGRMHCEPMFAAHRFRPLVARKTDIGFAHEILRKADRRAKAPIKREDA